MKIPQSFWSETAPRLTDVSLAALLYGLHRSGVDLPVGVLRTGEAWIETRFAWAADQVSAEIAAAPGVAVDPNARLAVVWEVAVAEQPRGPMPATAWARRLLATEASFSHELALRLSKGMDGATRAAFQKVLPRTWPRFKSPGLPSRRVSDPFAADLAAAKVLERQLRAEFSDVDDLGDKPSPADRRAFVGILGAGYTTEQVMDALRGRADKCRRSRRWRDIDTGQVFLRITWLCAEVRRFIEAEQVGASLSQDTTGIVIGESGRKFVGGREVYE